MQSFPQAEFGTRFVDTLAQVQSRSGEAGLVYIHVEIQGQREAAFAQRMFTYNYRLFDRYGLPILSLAVLSDEEPHWRPQE
ncbi:MAG: Rpn family recombination-promoting nuclease/putative transposase [Deltaproteobacteria bacterium]